MDVRDGVWIEFRAAGAKAMQLLLLLAKGKNRPGVEGSGWGERNDGKGVCHHTTGRGGLVEEIKAEGTFWACCSSVCKFPRLISEPPVLKAWYCAVCWRRRAIDSNRGISEGSGVPCRTV